MSSLRKRRCPPSVTTYGSRPASDQRITVRGCTRNSAATCALRSHSSAASASASSWASPRPADVCSAVESIAPRRGETTAGIRVGDRAGSLRATWSAARGLAVPVRAGANASRAARPCRRPPRPEPPKGNAGTGHLHGTAAMGGGGPAAGPEGESRPHLAAGLLPRRGCRPGPAGTSTSPPARLAAAVTLTASPASARPPWRAGGCRCR